MRKILLSFLLLVCLKSAIAQEGPYLSSGIGILAPGRGISSFYLNFPLAEIGLFDVPGGAKIGSLVKKNSINLMCKLASTQLTFRINNKDIVEIELAGYCLKYFEIDGSFAKVLVNSTGKGLWVSLSELQYLRYSAKPWLELMSEKKTFFYNMVDVGINLRKDPNQKSNKIILIKGNQYAITLTGKTEGLWAEATVGKYSQAPCKDLTATYKSTEEWKGWIKVIDDAGYPNIWFYPEGCK